MTTARKHRFSSGGGFGDPYAGFTLELDRDEDSFCIDPTDSHTIADLLDPENYTPSDVDADALLEVGLAYLAIEQYESAIDAFARVAWFAPESDVAIESWVSRGVALGQLEEYDEAIGAYLEALSLDPDPGVAAVAETNLAYALWESGDSSNPLEHAERAVELDPRLAEAWFNLGYLYNERGLSEDAVSALENAERLGYERSVVREELELARERLEEYDEMEEREAVVEPEAVEEREQVEAVERAVPEIAQSDADGTEPRERLGA